MSKSANERNRNVVDEPAGVDPQWEKKLETARRARQLGRSMRTGKAKSFRQAVGTGR